MIIFIYLFNFLENLLFIIYFYLYSLFFIYLFIYIIFWFLVFSIYGGVEFLAFNCNAQLKILILIIAQYKSINYLFRMKTRIIFMLRRAQMVLQVTFGQPKWR